MSPIGSVNPLNSSPLTRVDAPLPKIALPPVGPDQSTPAGGFGQLLDGLVESVAGKQEAANDLTRRVLLGDSTQLHQSVIAMQEASVAFSMMVEVRNKQKRESEQKFFPGYVLVEMELADDTWHLVRSTPKVTGFVGSGTRPVALEADQVDEIMRQMEAGAEKPKPKSVFQRGDKVRVIDGPFVNFQGVVDDMNPERGRMKVVVPVFGRPTPVELEYYQVERL